MELYCVKKLNIIEIQSVASKIIDEVEIVFIPFSSVFLLWL